MVVCMAVTAVWLNIDERFLVRALEEAGEKLRIAEGQVVLDFETVRRIDSSALQAMESIAGLADQRAIKVVLHGVNVDVYKVLKLVRLASRFSFVSSSPDLGPTESGSSHAKP
jgi:anti-anti-sigma regulatory factor